MQPSTRVRRCGLSLLLLLMADSAWGQAADGPLKGHDVCWWTPRLKVPTLRCGARRYESLAGGGADTRSAVPALIEALQDPDVAVRRFAVEALQGSGAPARTIRAVLLAAAQDSAAEVRQQALVALCRVDPTWTGAGPALVAACRDPDAGRSCRDGDVSGTVWRPGGAVTDPTPRGPRPDRAPERRPRPGEHWASGGRPRRRRCSPLRAIANRNYSSHAIDTLGAVGPEAKVAVPFLRGLLQDEDDVRTFHAALALVRIEPGQGRCPSAAPFAARRSERDRPMPFASRGSSASGRERTCATTRRGPARQ